MQKITEEDRTIQKKAKTAYIWGNSAADRAQTEKEAQHYTGCKGGERQRQIICVLCKGIPFPYSTAQQGNQEMEGMDADRIRKAMTVV